MNPPRRRRARRRRRTGSPAPSHRPVRIVHLGLGAFFRAHQAWYTAARPGRRAVGDRGVHRTPATAAARLAAQDGLYTLVTRGARRRHHRDHPVSVAAVHASTDHDACLRYLRDPAVAVLTLTVTEAGYSRVRAAGSTSPGTTSSPTSAALRADRAAPVTTVPARAAGRRRGPPRRRAAARRGRVLRQPPGQRGGHRAGRARPRGRDRPDLPDWSRPGRLRQHRGRPDHAASHGAGPRVARPRHRAARRRAGGDRAVQRVGPAGRLPRRSPAWEAAGARFVADIAPVRAAQAVAAQRRPLAAGVRRGRPRARDGRRGGGRPALPRRRSEQWWDEAQPLLGLPAEELAAYRSALAGRFANPRIRHELAQIADDGSRSCRCGSCRSSGRARGRT